MAGVIKLSGLEEGEFFCKWLYSRLIRNNKNALCVEVGSTGSGKSYRDLRKAELWYNNYLHKSFPVKNICFGVYAIMQRLTSGELESGDILIFEEAGANMGSLDFQNKVCKMFTYVLQSFRSMNIAIFFNLPYLSMLNKQARMLLHYSGESMGIDFKRNKNLCKPYFHQVNQITGKIYRKNPRGKYKSKVKKIKFFEYSIPGEEIANAYEKQKVKYLTDMQEGFYLQLQKLEAEKIAKMGRVTLTDLEIEDMKSEESGETIKEYAKRLGVHPSVLYRRRKNRIKKGYVVQISEIPKKMVKIDVKTPLIAPST